MRVYERICTLPSDVGNGVGEFAEVLYSSHQLSVLDR